MLVRVLAFTAMSMFFSVATGFAQKSPTGLMLEDETYEELPMVDWDNVRGGILPWKVNLKKYCPTPGDQGNTASCVGWALAYTLTIERAIRNSWTDRKQIDQSRHSASYIYNQIKQADNCFARAKMSEGLALLQLNGDCLASDFEDFSGNCSQMPTSAHHRLARNYSVEGFQRLFDNNAHSDRKVDAIRTILATDQPVMIGLVVPDDFRYGKLNQLNWDAAENGHALVVVGYNDGTEMFQVMNSYGSDWGNGGFFELSYVILGEVVRFGYRLVL